MFDILKEVDKKTREESVDFFEVFVNFALFSEGSFEVKITCFFDAFDLDGNGFMDKEEFFTFIISGIFGFCKLLKLFPLPYKGDVNNYAAFQFKNFRLNKEGMIERKDFSEWIKSSDEIQDFILQYTGVQTFDRAKKRYEKSCHEFEATFKRNSIDFMCEKYNMLEDLKVEL